MNERLALYREQLKGYWTRFNGKQKLMVGGIAFFLLVSLGLYIYFASQPVYTPLYDKRLSEQEIGMIKQELETQQVPYRLTNGGTGIEVPQVMAQDVIVDLAAQGIPKEAGISSEIFASSNFGITDRQFDMMKKDALQIEIKKMLERVQGVRAAQVILTLPDESIFVTDRPADSTASVIVDVEPGIRLNDQQIRALYYVVSRSTKSLPLENITITDQYSNMLELSEAGQSSGTLSAYEQQEKLKAEVEKKIQQNLYNLLGTIMGRDKVLVHATVEMDFAKENRVENLVEPVDKENNEGIVTSAEKLSKTFTGQGAPPSGVAGTGDNQVPGYPGANQQGSQSQYEELTDRVNREVNRITRNVTESPYQIKDISINVGVEPPNGQQQLDDATAENIKQMLRNVVRVTLTDKGFTPEQIDERISIFSRPFSGKVVLEEDTGLSPTLLYGAGALALLALGAVAFMVYRRRRQPAEVMQDFPDIPSPRSFDVPELAYNEDGDEVVVRKQLEKLARSKPDEFVVLLRTWLAED